MARGRSSKSILPITLLKISNLPEALSTTSVNLSLVLPPRMAELVKTKYYLQGDHPTHLWSKRKQRSSTPNVPPGRRGIKVSILLYTVSSIHGFKSAMAAELEPEHPKFHFPLNSLSSPRNSAGRNSFTPCYLKGFHLLLFFLRERG